MAKITVLGGGFGSFLDPQSAASIGMLPPELVNKTTVLGNASLMGAGLALTDENAREKLQNGANQSTPRSWVSATKRRAISAYSRIFSAEGACRFP